MWRWLAILTIVLASGSVDRAFADDQNQELDALIKQASELSGKGRFEEAISVGRDALALAEKTLGEAHPNLTPILTDLAQHYFAQLNFSEAETLWKRALEISDTSFGADDPRTTTIAFRLGELYRQQERWREANILLNRTLAAQEKLLGADDVQLVETLNSLGLASWNQGRYPEAEAFYKRGLAIAEIKPVPDILLESLYNNLAILADNTGRYKEADSFYRRALEIAERAFGAEHPEVGRVLTNFGILDWAQGLYSQAESLLQRALIIREKSLGPDHADVAHALNSLALVYTYQGRYEEAEPIYKRAIAIDEKVFGPEHSNLVSRLNNLADLYRRQGLFSQAEPLYKRALNIAETKLGPRHQMVAAVLNNLGWTYWAEGRYREAEPLYKRGLATAEQTLGADHPNLIVQYHNLGALYREQGRYNEAEQVLAKAIALGERVSPQHPNLGKALDNLALVYAGEGRYAESEALFKRAIEIAEAAYGPSHVDVAVYNNDLGALYASMSKWGEATKYLRLGSDILIDRTKRTHGSLDQAKSAAVPSDTIRAAEKLRLLVGTSFRLWAEAAAERPELLRQSFETAQWSQGSEAAASIAQMSARGTKGDPTLSSLIRERQDLVGEWQAKDKLLTASISKPPDKRVHSSEDILREEIAAIRTRLDAIHMAIAKDFPYYTALESPEPLSVAEIQLLMQPNEALTFFLSASQGKLAQEETFLWVVTKAQARWVRATLGTSALTELVGALRCGLDAASWDGALADQCRSLLNFARNGDSDVPLPFDLGRAHSLYKALFGEVESLIKGKSLLIVPSGPLTQIPFQVLVTKPPRDGSYKSAAWLIREHAVTVLPAVSSLKALRRLATASAATRPMIGFGNPLLDGNQSDPVSGDQYKRLAARARENQRCRSNRVERVAAARRARGGIDAIATKAGLADLDLLKVQMPLPETADELCSVARELSAGADDIYLGARATEHQVKALSASGELVRYRILHFATHGAMAGQVNGTSEPGLILTPPDQATSDDDGYLSAPEIAALKLDADWVILSACNTAAGGSTGTEALSGLARAFFYAQARALLVSHWAVDSNATVKLVTSTIGELARHKSIGRSEAFRRGMVTLIEKGQPHEAHPSYWAPFVLVGEGAPTH